MRDLLLIVCMFLICSGCAQRSAGSAGAGGKIVVGKTECAAPVADTTYTQDAIDAQVNFFSKTITNSKLSVDRKVELIRERLPDVDRFERVEYRLCLAHERGALTQEQYAEAVKLILPRIGSAPDSGK